MNIKHIRQVQKVLTEWNPLGERAKSISDLNNYETEATDILWHIDSKNDIDSVTFLIRQVFYQAFDLSINVEEAKPIAEKIHKIRLKK